MSGPQERAARLRILARLFEFEGARLRLASSAILATAAIQDLAMVFRRSEKADFMDLVLRYDEGTASESGTPPPS